jgi:HEAT repeat protein
MAVAQAQSTISARALLEQGHYARTQQQDPRTAEAKYTAALQAANAAEDTVVAQEAQSALDSLRSKPEAPSATLSLPVSARRILVDYAKERDRSRSDLALFGNAVVPVLGQMVASEPYSTVMLSEAGHSVTNDIVFAVSVLALIETPEAQAAILPALRSPDPLVRRGSVQALRPRHVDLLLVAVQDSVDAVREAALTRLQDVDDVRVAPVMAALAAEGHQDAIAWMMRHQPQELWLLAEKGIAGAPFDYVVELFQRQPMREDPLRRMNWVADRLVASTDPEVTKAAREYLTVMVGRLRTRDYLTDRSTWQPGVAKELHALARKTRLPALLTALRDTDASDLLVTIQEALRGEGVLEPAMEDAVYQVLASLEREPVAVDAWLDLYQASARRTDWTKHVTSSRAAERIGFALASRMRKEAEGQQREFLMVNLLRWYRLMQTPEERGAFRTEGISCLQQAFGTSRNAAKRSEALLSPDYVALGEWCGAGTYTLALYNACEWASSQKESLLQVLFAMRPQAPAIRAKEPIVRQIVEQSYASAQQATVREFEKQLKTSSRDLLVENTLIAALLPRPVYLTLLRSCATQWDSDQIALSIQGLVATGMRDAEVLELVLELTPRVAPHLTDTRLQILSLFADTLYQPAMPLLGEALRDSNPQIRSRAQEALQQFRQQREAMEEFGTWMQAARQQASTTAQLIELLQSQDRAVVLGAVRALGTIKARNALPELVKLLARNDAELTSAVEAAIAAM